MYLQRELLFLIINHVAIYYTISSFRVKIRTRHHWCISISWRLFCSRYRNKVIGLLCEDNTTLWISTIISHRFITPTFIDQKVKKERKKEKGTSIYGNSVKTAPPPTYRRARTCSERIRSPLLLYSRLNLQIHPYRLSRLNQALRSSFNSPDYIWSD